MEAVTGVGASSGAAETAPARSPFDSQLSRDAFLQLLVLQMQNQDPLDPVDNQDMLAQLAQFTALEQMNNLNEQFETLSGNVDQLNFISASQLLGNTVSGVDSDGLPHRGVVQSVGLDGSVVELIVSGRRMSMAGILGIEQGAVQ